jgi:membrane protein implicated in regulation of membrane protease activity
MLGKLWALVRPVLFWEYRRGSWQYDLIVVAILAFIFLTPRSVFNDQPRLPNIREVKALSDEQDTRIFLVESGAVEGKYGDERETALSDMLRHQMGDDLEVVETRPTTNEQGEVTAYLIYTRP